MLQALNPVAPSLTPNLSSLQAARLQQSASVSSSVMPSLPSLKPDRFTALSSSQEQPTPASQPKFGELCSLTCLGILSLCCLPVIGLAVGAAWLVKTAAGLAGSASHALPKGGRAAALLTE